MAHPGTLRLRPALASAAIRSARRRRGVAWTTILAAGLLLAACAYRGGIDEPLTRRATWFSYLDGGDIRDTCAPGAVDRYRLVYNGRYQEQLRSYEVTGDGAGGAILVARALAQATLTELRLDDLLAPWRWRRAEARLSPADMAAFESALQDSGFFAAPPDGLRLNSWEFYWVASGCRNGRFEFSAWVHPSARWNALAFPDLLFARDETGVPVNPPRPLPASERFGPAGGREERGAETRFSLQVDGKGLGGLMALD